MRASTILAALLVSLAACAPIEARAPEDGIWGGVLYADRFYTGATVGCLGNSWCMNLHGIDWDRKARSVAVEKGYTCAFYTEHDCPTWADRLVVGNNDTRVGVPELRSGIDANIRAVYCARM